MSPWENFLPSRSARRRSAIIIAVFSSSMRIGPTRNARSLFQWSNHVKKQLFFKLKIICTSSRFKLSEFLEASDSTHAAGCLLGARTPRRLLVEATQAKAQLGAAA